MLGPGETTPFEISVLSENAEDIESYKLFADSNDYTYSQVIMPPLQSSETIEKSFNEESQSKNDDEDDEDEDEEDNKDDDDEDEKESTETRLENMFNQGST